MAASRSRIAAFVRACASAHELQAIRSAPPISSVVLPSTTRMPTDDDAACRLLGCKPVSASSQSGSAKKRVLIAGGGVAALEAVIALRNLAGYTVAITMLS